MSRDYITFPVSKMAAARKAFLLFTCVLVNPDIIIIHSMIRWKCNTHALQLSKISSFHILIWWQQSCSWFSGWDLPWFQVHFYLRIECGKTYTTRIDLGSVGASEPHTLVSGVSGAYSQSYSRPLIHTHDERYKKLAMVQIMACRWSSKTHSPKVPGIPAHVEQCVNTCNSQKVSACPTNADDTSNLNFILMPIPCSI